MRNFWIVKNSHFNQRLNAFDGFKFYRKSRQRDDITTVLIAGFPDGKLLTVFLHVFNWVLKKSLLQKPLLNQSRLRSDFRYLRLMLWFCKLNDQTAHAAREFFIFQTYNLKKLSLIDQKKHFESIFFPLADFPFE